MAKFEPKERAVSLTCLTAIALDVHPAIKHPEGNSDIQSSQHGN